MRTCTRFEADGTRCANTTRNGDGWCRHCAGFSRPESTPAPPPKPAVPPPPEVVASWSVPTDLDVDDVGSVEISRRAIDGFVRHHGGSAAEAELQLRNMLEDFLLDSHRRRINAATVQLRRDGYALLLSADGYTVTKYSTHHRERTWEQTKAGVPSRSSARKRREGSGTPPEPGVTVPRDRFAHEFDPQTVYLTATARKSFEKLAGLRSVDDAELDLRLRQAASAIGGGDITQHDNGCFEITHDGAVWFVAPDCSTIYSVRKPT